MAASFGRYAFSSDDAREVASASVKYRSEITDDTKEALVQALQDKWKCSVAFGKREFEFDTHDMLEKGTRSKVVVGSFVVLMREMYFWLPYNTS